jgi:broad specificity phosphatase PhoE
MNKGPDSSKLPSPAKDSCVLYLLRHGATDNNLADPVVLQGRSADPELSEQGRQQAVAAAEFLARPAISAVYSSPLRRAVETAAAIASTHQVRVNELVDLIEVDVGNWEGRDWDEISRTEPAAYQHFIEDPGRYPYAGGENFGEVAARILPRFDQLLDDHAGESIIVVGHNIVNRVYLAHLTDIPLRHARQIRQSNCGINVIRRIATQDRLITLNAVFHLDFY